MIEFNLPNSIDPSIIKVIGVGGGGGNAVNNMLKMGIQGVEFIVCNTDKQVLQNSFIDTKVQLGHNLTEGLGAGGDPEIGRKSALESIEEIREILKRHTKMVFITAGMGGGTGTGAAPVIAALAKEMGILTVGIVTTPFKFEGEKRLQTAFRGVAELEKCVDTLLIINNTNLLQTCSPSIKAREAFLTADRVLGNAAKGIADIIGKGGYINVDFADVHTIMHDSGKALMGIGTATGEHRALRAVEDALSSPLLDNLDIHGASGILWSVTASEETLSLTELDEVGQHIKEAAGEQAHIISGIVNDDSMGDKLSVTLIATGFSKNKLKEEISEFTQNFQQNNQPKNNDRQPENQPKTAVKENILTQRKPQRQSEELDFHNPKTVKELESQPAYLRKSLFTMEDSETARRNPLSRFSIDPLENGRTQLRDNNSFLYDNVD